MSKRQENVLVILALGAAVLLSVTAILCINNRPDTETNEKGEYKDHRKIVADGCEYLIFDEFKTFRCVTHKGNCKFCLERKR